MKCYVYLSDVSAKYKRISGESGHSIDLEATHTDLARSRWLTRGWTLQELLTPRTVEFYDRSGNFIGNKASLESQLRVIGGIDKSTLRGEQLSHSSVETRMDWARTRQTTIEEDQAYRLFGIFEIHLPLIYGEGQANAFARWRTRFRSRQKDTRGDPLRNEMGDGDVICYHHSSQIYGG